MNKELFFYFTTIVLYTIYIYIYIKFQEKFINAFSVSLRKFDLSEPDIEIFFIIIPIVITSKSFDFCFVFV